MGDTLSFPRFLVTLAAGTGVAITLVAFSRAPPLPVFFRVCERLPVEKTLTRTLTLFCFPESKGYEVWLQGHYKTLREQSSNVQLIPNQKAYLDVERKGGVRVKDDIKDFSLT